MTASDTPLISNVFGRKHQSLNGAWHTIVDPYENGYYDYRYEPNVNNYGLNQKPKDPGDRVEYDFDQSPTLKVPGDWNSQRRELSLYEGTIWYKTAFKGKRSDDERLFLPFGAANYDGRENTHTSREFASLVVDLLSQLAGWRHDQYAHSLRVGSQMT